MSFMCVCASNDVTPGWACWLVCVYVWAAGSPTSFLYLSRDSLVVCTMMAMMMMRLRSIATYICIHTFSANIYTHRRCSHTLATKIQLKACAETSTQSAEYREISIHNLAPVTQIYVHVPITCVPHMTTRVLLYVVCERLVAHPKGKFCVPSVIPRIMMMFRIVLGYTV